MNLDSVKKGCCDSFCQLTTTDGCCEHEDRRAEDALSLGYKKGVGEGSASRYHYYCQCCRDRLQTHTRADEEYDAGSQIGMGDNRIREKMKRNLHAGGIMESSKRFISYKEENGMDSERDKSFGIFYLLDGGVLEEPLRSGAIVLLDAHWIMEFASDEDNRLPSRQQLPPAAVIPFEELVLSRRLDMDQLNIIALSYMWLSKGHPDPDGSTLQLVANGLKEFLKTHQDRWGLFWDYASLYQNERTVQQEVLFQEGLKCMAKLYSHVHTSVFMVTELPPALLVSKSHNSTPYLLRGWTNLEFSLASLIKPHFMLYDLCFLVPDVSNSVPQSQEHYELLQRLRTLARDFSSDKHHRTNPVPRSPESFNEFLKSLSFTNEREDSVLVQSIYNDEFTATLASVDRLSFGSGAITEKQAIQLLGIIDDGFVPHLLYLDLSRSQLGIDFCRAFARSTLPAGLTSLDLSNNWIKDGGMEILAPCLNQMKEINLTNVGVQTSIYSSADSMCRSLASQFSEKTKWEVLDLSENGQISELGLRMLTPAIAQLSELYLSKSNLTKAACHVLVDAMRLGKLKCLDLSFNRQIGDDGITALLVPSIYHLERLHLIAVGMTDKGCAALIDNLPCDTKWKELCLWYNKLKDQRPLVKLVQSVRSMKELVLFDTGMDSEKMEMLKAHCEKEDVKFGVEEWEEKS